MEQLSLNLEKKKLNIALLTYSTKPRGGVIHTIELAQALHALKQNVCVYALDKDGAGFYRPLNYPYQLVPTRSAPKTIDALIQQRIKEFADYLEKSPQKYDIYHAQDCISANALSLLRDKHLISQFIRTVHHLDEFNSLYLQQCHDRSINEPDLCLCVSPYWQKQLQQQYKVNAPVVINGVDTQRFSPQPNGLETQLKQRLGITGNPVYLSIGGIEPRKNSLRLLQAFIKIRDRYPQAQLIIAGGETLFDYQAYRDEFFQVVEEANLTIGESLILPGVIDDRDMPTLYRCADAFVLPSVKEGWGMVILEAIASGIPVITANIPPFTEFLTPQQALLIDPYSVEEIAQAMLEIIEPNLSKSLVENSQNICDRYRWETSAKMHLKYYQKFISNA